MQQDKRQQQTDLDIKKREILEVSQDRYHSSFKVTHRLSETASQGSRRMRAKTRVLFTLQLKPSRTTRTKWKTHSFKQYDSTAGSRFIVMNFEGGAIIAFNKNRSSVSSLQSSEDQALSILDFQDVWVFEFEALDSPTGLFCRAWC